MDFVTYLHYKTQLYRSETSNAGQGTIYILSYHITLVFEEPSVRTRSIGRVIDSLRVFFFFVRSMHHTLGNEERRNGEKNEKKR
jgi:hypothetical protein